MEIIIPVDVKLKPILGQGPSRYPEWAVVSQYDYTPTVGLFVYDANNGHNYELVSRAAWDTYVDFFRVRPSELFRGWKDLGPSPGNVIGYVTNQPISPYPEWVDDPSVIATFTAGSRCYFLDSGREYQSVFDFSQDYDTDLFDNFCVFAWCATQSGGGWLSQSCVNFVDARYPSGPPCITPNQYQKHPGWRFLPAWVDIGPINALRALDPQSSLRTQGTSPLTMTVQASGSCDRIAFFGLKDVDTITVGGDVNIPATSLQTGATGLQRSSIVMPHAVVTDPEYELTFTSSATSPYPIQAQPAVGAIVAGRALDCGPTEANIQSALVTPRLTENERGNVSRSRQWYSKRIQGTVRPPARTADLAMTVLAQNVGNPLAIDFSRGQLAESGPLVYGFLESANHTITGIPSADAVDIVMRGYSQ